MNGFGTTPGTPAWDGVIRTAADWWNSCEARWENILDIFSNVGADMGRSEEAHWWSDGYGTADVHHEKCLVQHITDLKTARNGRELALIFNRIFHGAPDKGYIHSWAGWGAFCDLCNENWVFDPEQAPRGVGQTHDDPVGSFSLPNDGKN